MDKSTQENVRESSVIDNTAGTGRSYECTFCRRGFTNAQALGGHMNIHRKEKAKASKQTDDSFHKPSFSYPPFFSTNIESSKCPDHQFYLPLRNPSHSSYARNQSDSNLKNLGSNLSLDMGSWRSSKDKDDEFGAIDEKLEHHQVDLELRLGHDPYGST